MVTTDSKEPIRIVQRKGFMSFAKAIKCQKFINDNISTGDDMFTYWRNKDGDRVISSEL